MSIEIKGAQFGVRFVPRGLKDDPHVCIQLLSEDDGFWHKKGGPFSSFWIGDLIRVLELAKAALERMPKDPSGFGWRFEDGVAAGSTGGPP